MPSLSAHIADFNALPEKFSLPPQKWEWVRLATFVASVAMTVFSLVQPDLAARGWITIAPVYGMKPVYGSILHALISFVAAAILLRLQPADPVAARMEILKTMEGQLPSAFQSPKGFQFTKWDINILFEIDARDMTYEQLVYKYHGIPLSEENQGRLRSAFKYHLIQDAVKKSQSLTQVLQRPDCQQYNISASEIGLLMAYQRLQVSNHRTFDYSLTPFVADGETRQLIAKEYKQFILNQKIGVLEFEKRFGKDITNIFGKKAEITPLNQKYTDRNQNYQGKWIHIERQLIESFERGFAGQHLDKQAQHLHAGVVDAILHQELQRWIDGELNFTQLCKRNGEKLFIDKLTHKDSVLRQKFSAELLDVLASAMLKDFLDQGLSVQQMAAEYPGLFTSGIFQATTKYPDSNRTLCNVLIDEMAKIAELDDLLSLLSIQNGLLWTCGIFHQGVLKDRFIRLLGNTLGSFLNGKEWPKDLIARFGLLPEHVHTQIQNKLTAATPDKHKSIVQECQQLLLPLSLF